MTVCIPLSGRIGCWKLTAAFLRDQTHSKSDCRLHLLDTSNNPVFHELLQQWRHEHGSLYHTVVVEQRRFNSIDSINVADAPRNQYFDVVNQTMVQIYNHFKTVVVGGTTFILEDDVIPPLDAITRLAESIRPRVFSVSGAYPIRRSTAWTVWRELHTCTSTYPIPGVEVVKATGFGCLLLSTRDFQQAVIDWQARPQQHRAWPWGYDMHFFERIAKTEKLVLVDWDVRCQHVDNAE